MATDAPSDRPANSLGRYTSGTKYPGRGNAWPGAASLFNNAADAAPFAVALEAHWDSQELTLDILDRGQGFNQEAATRAGEIFFTTKQGQGGFGLGLFLANASIERLGGSVRMLPRGGGGAHIVVCLPLHEPRTP